MLYLCDFTLDDAREDTPTKASAKGSQQEADAGNGACNHNLCAHNYVWWLLLAGHCVHQLTTFLLILSGGEGKQLLIKLWLTNFVRDKSVIALLLSIIFSFENKQINLHKLIIQLILFAF
jgi:hypothetical protein